MKLDVYYEVVYTVVYDNEFSLQKPLQLAFKMTLSIYTMLLYIPPPYPSNLDMWLIEKEIVKIRHSF